MDKRTQDHFEHLVKEIQHNKDDFCKYLERTGQIPLLEEILSLYTESRTKASKRRRYKESGLKDEIEKLGQECGDSGMSILKFLSTHRKKNLNYWDEILNSMVVETFYPGGEKLRPIYLINEIKTLLQNPEVLFL